MQIKESSTKQNPDCIFLERIYCECPSYTDMKDLKDHTWTCLNRICLCGCLFGSHSSGIPKHCTHCSKSLCPDFIEQGVIML